MVIVVAVFFGLGLGFFFGSDWICIHPALENNCFLVMSAIPDEEQAKLSILEREGKKSLRAKLIVLVGWITVDCILSTWDSYD